MTAHGVYFVYDIFEFYCISMVTLCVSVERAREGPVFSRFFMCFFGNVFLLDVHCVTSHFGFCIFCTLCVFLKRF